MQVLDSVSNENQFPLRHAITGLGGYGGWMQAGCRSDSRAAIGAGLGHRVQIPRFSHSVFAHHLLALHPQVALWETQARQQAGPRGSFGDYETRSLKTQAKTG